VSDPTEPLYVAIVEDDEQVRRALARLLTEVGYDVRTFGSAREFMNTLPGLAPACLVLDAHLPDASGLAVLRRLRRDGHRSGVVFITADTELAASDQMHRSGAPCLCKPLDVEALVGAINNVMQSV
jgi:FixJ family two-component response regulator